jgi:hypothetical protein
MNVPVRHVAAFLAASVLVIAAPAAAQAPLTVASPDSRTAVHVEIREGHRAQRDARPARIDPAVDAGFRVSRRAELRAVSHHRHVDATTTAPDAAVGEVARVRDHHNELRVWWRRPAPG